MERTGTALIEKFSKESVEPLVKSFFGRITEEQLSLLKSGSPDDATKILLAELVLATIRSVTEKVLVSLRGIDVPESEKHDLPCGSEVLAQIPAQALGFPEQVDSVDSESLSDLIAGEVREIVASSSSQSAQPVIDKHVIPPHRLSAMIGQISGMLMEFMAKVKTFAHRPQKKTDFILEDVDDETDLEKDLELSDDNDVGQSSDRSGDTDTTEKVSSEDSFKSKTSESLQEEIGKELRTIISPLLDELPDSENKKLQSEISLQLKSLSDDISDFICVKAKKRPLKKVRNMIKHFLAKCFAKVCIHRFLAQLRKKHRQQTNVESCELAESLEDRLTSQLQIDHGEKQAAGNWNSLMLWFNNISSAKVLIFHKELSDLIYRHFLSEIVPESVMGKQTQEKPFAPESHADMYADIRSKVWIFVVLMNWWLKTEVNRLSERVHLPIMDTVQLPDAAEDAACEETRQDAALQTETNRKLVKVLIEKVLWQVYCDVQMVPERGCDISDHLFESVWPEVEDVDLHVTPETFKSLAKKIYKDLCKKWDDAHHVLCLLKLQDPDIDKYIVHLLKVHMTSPPKRPNAFCRFFSSLGKALSKPFRRRNKVGVLLLETSFST